LDITDRILVVQQSQINIMRKFILMITIAFLVNNSNAQHAEKYGKTLNIGLGVGYYGYIQHSIPVIHANYEFDVARNFTLAPFITVFSYQDNYNYYHQTVVPIGVKGSYYFDQLVDADPKWDFYGAGSLGFAIVNTTWESGYTGQRNSDVGAGALYLDLHIGTEYHFNNKIGAFLDLSTGVSTVGLAFHKF
jgi:hypothetical protein